MIYLISGSNSVITTLNRGETASSFYTWQIIDKDTKLETIFYSNDISPNPLDYNKFIITITSSVGLTAGMINIPYSEYEYKIWEMPDQMNLNIASASSLAEVGLIRYLKEPILYNRTENNLEVFNGTSSVATFGLL